MSSSQETSQKAKNSLATFMAGVEPAIKEAISHIPQDEVEFILKEYRPFLKLNLETYFEEARVDTLKTSPFDDILNDYTSK